MNITSIIISECSALDVDLTLDTNLFGSDGVFDSMGLVSLIVANEERIEEEFSIAITIADERAMSQSKSPFRTVRSLGDYIKKLMKEEGINV